MEALYHNTNKMVHEVHNELSRLERATGEDVHVLENEVMHSIEIYIFVCLALYEIVFEYFSLTCVFFSKVGISYSRQINLDRISSILL